MAITALNKVSTANFILESDDGDEPTIWKLKPMDGQQYMGVMAEGNETPDGGITFSNRTMRDKLQYGLVGWDNFKDADEKDIKFSRMNFGRIPVEALTVIFSEIIKRSSPDEDEIKN